MIDPLVRYDMENYADGDLPIQNIPRKLLITTGKFIQQKILKIISPE
jgi:hypothetical protein